MTGARKPVRPPGRDDIARELAPSRCAVCGGVPVVPVSAMCGPCDEAWMASAERARAGSARADFVNRRRAEIGTRR